MAGGRLGSIAERHARAEAAKIAAAFGIERPEHIRVEDIAWTLGLRIIEGGLTGAAARLSVRDGRGIIRVRPSDAGTPRVRFSVAHEVGHFVLHRERIKVCTEADLVALHEDGGAEAQANVFASELLVPAAMCDDVRGTGAPDFALARDLAVRFNVGLTAAALRVVELSPEPCALLYVVGDRVQWYRRGTHFERRLNVLGPPHRASVVARVARQVSVPGPEVVDAGCWLEDVEDDELGELTEDVVPMPSTGGFLVFLHLAAAEDFEE